MNTLKRLAAVILTTIYIIGIGLVGLAALRGYLKPETDMDQGVGVCVLALCIANYLGIAYFATSKSQSIRSIFP